MINRKSSFNKTFVLPSESTFKFTTWILEKKKSICLTHVNNKWETSYKMEMTNDKSNQKSRWTQSV